MAVAVAADLKPPPQGPMAAWAARWGSTHSRVWPPPGSRTTPNRPEWIIDSYQSENRMMGA